MRNENIDWDNDLYGEYSMHNYGIADMRCYNTNEWKLIVDFHNENRNELYNMAADPDKRTNLINEKSPQIRLVIGELRKSW